MLKVLLVSVSILVLLAPSPRGNEKMAGAPLKLWLDGANPAGLFMMTGNTPVPTNPAPLHQITNTNTVGAGAPIFLFNFSNGVVYPDVEGGQNSSDTYISQVPYKGKLEAGTWTFQMGGLLFNTGANPPPSEPVSWHLRVRFYKTSAASNSGGAFDNHGTLLGTGSYNGTVAVSGYNSLGVSVVSATMPQINLNNEYLCVQIAFQLDSTIAGNTVRFGEQTRSPNTFMQTSNFVNTDIITPPSLNVCPPIVTNGRERYSWITPSNVEYPLDVPQSRFVLSSEGEGLPPINYLTQRGPFQDGATLIDEFLQPRIVQLVVRHNYSSRQAYDAGRQYLVGVLNPHLQLVEGAQQCGRLRKYLTSGAVRDLYAIPIQGPNFAPRGTDWQEWSYQEVLRFQGLDPVYQNPTQHSQAFAGQGPNLVGPVTGPLTGNSLDSTVTVSYQGTYKSYPSFTVVGPFLAMTLLNQTTGESITVAHAVPAGRTMTISLVQGAKTVTLDDGTDLIGYVTHDSDLASFHLTENNDGVNVLRVVGSGVTLTTIATVYWYDRYMGI
jgi:hypothetical protein